MEHHVNDIASVGHWESVWKNTEFVHGFSTWNYYDFRLSRIFQSLVSPASKVIEIGCGGSRWLGYFDRVLRCETWGIDYSPEGLRLAGQSNADRRNLHLVAGDFFDSSRLPSEHFDLVYSLGFVEHFSDTSVATRRISEILRPGGKIMTLIPNFVGAYGRIQRFVNLETFEKHVVLNPSELDAAHTRVGLRPWIPAHYFGCFGPGVVDYGRWQRLILPLIKVTQHSTCWSLHSLHLDRESRFASPYIVGVYEKPEAI